MGSTDKLTPTYITPLRRSLGLSRRLKSNTNSPVTPSSITTPLRSCSYNSPNITKNITNENLNKTPILNITPQISKCMSPLKSESANRTESSKRSYRLSLNHSKIQGIPLVKKKKLEFIENGSTSDDETEKSVDTLPKIISFEDVESTRNNEELEDDYISSSQMVTFEILTQIPNTELESNEELANEFKEIELLKQKQYRRRISYGLKVREDKLKDIDELNASIKIKGFCKEIEQSQNVEFHTAKHEIETMKIVLNSSTRQQSHEQEITEIKNLIKIWKRGLRDAVEYLSCLSYPPTDTRAILQHHNIPPELLID